MSRDLLINKKHILQEHNVYVTSNGSWEQFPNNKLTEFGTELTDTFTCNIASEKWMMGVKSVTFASDFYRNATDAIPFPMMVAFQSNTRDASKIYYMGVLIRCPEDVYDFVNIFNEQISYTSVKDLIKLEHSYFGGLTLSLKDVHVTFKKAFLDYMGIEIKDLPQDIKPGKLFSWQEEEDCYSFHADGLAEYKIIGTGIPETINKIPRVVQVICDEIIPCISSNNKT